MACLRSIEELSIPEGRVRQASMHISGVTLQDIALQAPDRDIADIALLGVNSVDAPRDPA